jgi:hypothetical protein
MPDESTSEASQTIPPAFNFSTGIIIFIVIVVLIAGGFFVKN